MVNPVEELFFLTNRPFDLLNEAIGKEVLVSLKGDTQIRGTLKAFDVHMNIVLEHAEQHVNGEPKTKFKQIILRGDNVILIAP